LFLFFHELIIVVWKKEVISFYEGGVCMAQTGQSLMHHRRSSRFAILLYFVLIVVIMSAKGLAITPIITLEASLEDSDGIAIQDNLEALPRPSDPREDRSPNDGADEMDNQQAILWQETQEDGIQKVVNLCNGVEGFRAARAALFPGLGKGHFDPKSAPD
jgi:hypothetical protein